MLAPKLDGDFDLVSHNDTDNSKDQHDDHPNHHESGKL